MTSQAHSSVNMSKNSFDRNDLYEAAKANDAYRLREIIEFARNDELDSPVLLQYAWGVMSSTNNTKRGEELDRMDETVHVILSESVRRNIPDVLTRAVFAMPNKTAMERACEVLSIKTAAYLVKLGVSPYIDEKSASPEFFPLGKPLDEPWTRLEIQERTQEFTRAISSAYLAKQAFNVLDELDHDHLYEAEKSRQSKPVLG